MEIYNEKLRDLLDVDFQKTYSSNTNLTNNNNNNNNTNNSSNNFNNSFNGSTNFNNPILNNTHSNSNTNISNILNQINSNQKNLKIREHPTKGEIYIFILFDILILTYNLMNADLKGIYVQNLNQYSVTDLKTTMRYLIRGNQNR